MATRTMKSPRAGIPCRPSAIALAVAGALVAAAQNSFALPTGGEVAAGQATISQPSASSLQITQGTQKAILNWQGFSIGKSEAVNFTQPSASAVALNRVLGSNPSHIFGRLTANGQVFLSNPSGVIFGRTASVDVGGLVATTLSISDSDFLSGNYVFSNGGAAGAVINEGSIVTANGYTALVGPQVTNDGIIAARLGSVALAAADRVTLDMVGDGLISLSIDQAAVNAAAINSGTITADGGHVLLTARSANALLDTVVNNSGIIRANSLVERNGEIVLDGGGAGEVVNSNSLEAVGVDAGSTGGDIKILGDKVLLSSTSRINVSGDAGGGTLLVGGNFHGAGPEQNASVTSVEAGSVVSADALNAGNGGNVAIWSDGKTAIDGVFSVRGGSKAGNGGYIETSGLDIDVASTTRVDARAPSGRSGTWLIDPADFLIAAAGGDMTGATLGLNLDSANVRILSDDGGAGTNGDILVQDSVTWTSSNTLELSAFRDVTFDASGVLTANAGAGNVILRADNTGTGTGTVTVAPGSIDVGTGSVTVYYNPTSYAALVDYGADPAITAGTVNSHAWVFLAGAVVADKVYDGNASATINTHAAFVGDPTDTGANDVALDDTGATATFEDKNAAVGKTVNLLGYVLTGADEAKFAIFDNGGTAAGGIATFQTTTTAEVAKLDTNISGTRVYDATNTAAAADFSVISALIGGDTVTIGGAGTLADKHVGLSKAVTNGTLALGGADGGNYNLLASGNTLTVTQLDTNISGTRVYDATNTAAAADFSAISTLIGGDTVTIGGAGTLADKHVGLSKAVTNGTLALGGADGGNYNLLASGNTLTVTQLDTNISGTRVYDATNTAAAADFSAISALIGGDTVTIGGAGTLADKHVGLSKAVTNGTLALGGADGGNYNLLASGNTLTVTQLDTNISGTRVYDATNTAAAADFSVISALIGGDTVTIGGAGTLADKHVGLSKAVTNGTLALGGADGGNYNLLASGNTLTVTQLDTNISGTRVYDATNTAAAADFSAISALIGGDTVTIGGAGTLADKHVGLSKAVTNGTLALGGADGGNYNLLASGNTLTVTQLDTNISGTRVYDATNTAAAADFSAISALIGGDTVTIGGAGTLADKHVGLSKAVTNGTLALGGADGGNYNLLASGNTLTVTQLDTNISGTRVYDATNTAAAADFSVISALIGGDTVTIGGAGTLADKHVGLSKAVTNGTLALGGADGGNYNLLASGNTLTVTQLDTNISGTRVYDATNTAAAADFSAISALIGGDTVTIGGAGTLADKHVGLSKAVTNGTLALGGADGGNYNLLASGNTLTVTQLDTNISGTRVYDATNTAAAADFSAISALIGGDTVTIGGAGTLADKHVGLSKAVTNGTLALGGADGGNYNLLASGNTLTVTQLDTNISGTRVYDATNTAAAADFSVISALIGGDTVTIGGAGTLADKHVGLSKAVTNGTLALGGADAANYNLLTAGNALTVTQRDVTLTAPIVTKTYDGLLTYTTNLGDLSSIGSVLLSGDTISSATIAYTNKDVGAGNKTVTLSSASINDGNGGANYNIVAENGNSASSITRRTSVTWTGNGDGTNWSDAANWDGAIPDLANVANVNLGGAIVTFSNAVTPLSGSVQIDGLTNGRLTFGSGALAVANTANLTGYTQAAGTMSVGGNLAITASSAVTQTGGALDVTGTSIIAAGANAITLAAASNDFGGAVTLSNTSGAAQVRDANAITIGNSSLGGSLTVNSGGLITLGSVTTSGTQQYNNSVSVGGTYNTGGGNFGVTGATGVATGSTITTGPGNVMLAGAVDGPGALTINSSGATTFGSTIGQTTALASISTDIAGSTSLGGNVRTTGAISFRDPTNAAGRTLASVSNAGIRINIPAAGSSPATIDTSGNVTLDGPQHGSNGGEIDFTKTPNSLVLTQLSDSFFTGPAIPATLTFVPNSSVTYNGILIAASIAQQQAGQAASAAQGSAAAATVQEANETFGTDSVAEQVEYGFAGDVGTTPPMDHRLEETGISVPACLEESREGVACR